MRTNDWVCKKPSIVTPSSCTGRDRHYTSLWKLYADTGSGSVCGGAYVRYDLKYIGDNVTYITSMLGTANPLQIASIEYDPKSQTWKGEASAIPGESDYDYHWNFEFWFQCQNTSNLAAWPAGLRGVCWVTNDDGDVLSDYISFTKNSGFQLGEFEYICWDNDSGCTEEGTPIDNQAVLPKFLFGIPRQYKLTVSGLSTLPDGDLSGEYILENGQPGSAGNGVSPCTSGNWKFYFDNSYFTDPTYDLTRIPQECPDYNRYQVFYFHLLSGCVPMSGWNKIYFYGNFYNAGVVSIGFYAWSGVIGWNLGSYGFDPFGNNTLNLSTSPATTANYNAPATIALDFESF